MTIEDGSFKIYLKIFKMIKKHMKWDNDKTLMWMNTENPMFGGISAATMFGHNRGHKVLKYVQICIEENSISK